MGAQWLFVYILLTKGLWSLGNILEPGENCHQRLTQELGLRFARDGEETDHVNKTVLLRKGLHVLPPASQALCHMNQLASLELGRGFPCTHSRALLHPADMIYGLSMQWSMGKSFSVLHLPIKCFHSLPTTGQSAVLVPQHRLGTYSTVIISMQFKFS